jgi:uncharacterized protein YndB with AHSA1/START domain
MARIVFEMEVEAPPTQVLTALDTQRGVAGWWSEDVTFSGGSGSVMTIGFPGRAPLPFRLRVDEATQKCVRWTNVGDFPPHWVGTEVTWTLKGTDAGTTVHFSHDGWQNDEGAFPMSALTWGQLMGSLKSWVETGQGAPLYRKN